MKFFEFTKSDYEYFVEEGMLNEEFSDLLKYEIMGYGRIKIAQLLNCSESALDKKIKELKKKIKKML